MNGITLHIIVKAVYQVGGIIHLRPETPVQHVCTKMPVNCVLFYWHSVTEYLTEENNSPAESVNWLSFLWRSLHGCQQWVALDKTLQNGNTDTGNWPWNDQPRTASTKHYK